MSDVAPVRRLTCGTCRYYAERPADLLGVCHRAGVCLKCAKPVDPDFGTTVPQAPGCHVTVIDRERGVVRPGCWREAAHVATWRQYVEREMKGEADGDR